MEELGFSDYIGSLLYVTVTRRRMLVGVLVATDSELNLLLDNVEEITAGGRRKLGLMSVPRVTIASIQMEELRVDALVRARRMYVV
ncbi:LAQU0S02e02586g1_1 [Lachancea quebecensis]|uniref:LAQU0S02e02586g1_1 n=1 Tax=Lachancea quebecensis TaxID=1654605 RepID=A0A0P1KMK1_9SACH|nr:LAQU0S02e02586g1_1 [Lachancea quebecensis]